MNILPIDRGITPAVTDVAPSMSLPDRVANAWADAYLDAGADLAAIRAASNDPRTASDPESLFRTQVALQDYTLRMTVTAGVVKDAVNGAETLLKS